METILIAAVALVAGYFLRGAICVRAHGTATQPSKPKRKQYDVVPLKRTDFYPHRAEVFYLEYDDDHWDMTDPWAPEPTRISLGVYERSQARFLQDDVARAIENDRSLRDMSR